MSRTVFTGLLRTPRYAGWERTQHSHWSATPSRVPSHHHSHPGMLDCCPSSAPIPLCPASALTKLGHVVDERVSLTVSVQISQLSAAVESQVVDAEPSLPCTAGVEQGAARCQGVLGDHVVSALIVQVRPTEPKERRDFA